MALETAFQELSAELNQLREALLALRITVVEDRPLIGDVVLVDIFGDGAEELLGWLDEALAAVAAGRDAAGRQRDAGAAARALVTCQGRFNTVAHRFWSELNAYERVGALEQFGRGRGGEWGLWSQSVKVALGRCQQPLEAATQAFFRSWQEIAERQMSAMEPAAPPGA